MNQKFNLTLALIAGLAGGFASRYLTPTPVFAQAQALIPKEIKAQKFVIVNEEGQALGVFGFDSNGTPMVNLTDENGRTVWSTQLRILRQPEPLNRR
jgi:hypothetical protein